MKNIAYKKQQHIPVIASVDVLVVGGGPGGLGAAVMAARQGATTLLVERYGCMGGMAFHGEVNPFMYNHVAGRSLDRPVFVDWCKAMQKYLTPNEAERIPYDHGYGMTLVSKEFAMLGMEDLVLESGAKILYHHTLADVIMDGDSIKYAVFQSKSGLSAIESKTFIDCTGDGDLAVAAGCKFEFGGDDGFCQPMTTCFKLGGIDVKNIPDRKTINQLYAEARARGEVDSPRDNILFFTAVDQDVLHFNTTRIIKKSGVNALDLSDAEIEGRRQMRQIIEFLRKNVPGFANATLRSIACVVGIRESRRIIGQAYQTKDDFINRAKYPDGIARCNYPVDIHSNTGADQCVKIDKNDWYEIRYGTLVAADCNNLLIGCRALSVDHTLHSSIRIMPAMCSIGQAAGMGAALAVKSGVKPGEIDGSVVRAELKKNGAEL